MGFPESFATPPLHDTKGVAQFYRQIGNAACPPVVQAIGVALVRLLAPATVMAAK